MSSSSQAIAREEDPLKRANFARNLGVNSEVPTLQRLCKYYISDPIVRYQAAFKVNGFNATEFPSLMDLIKFSFLKNSIPNFKAKCDQLPPAVKDDLTGTKKI